MEDIKSKLNKILISGAVRENTDFITSTIPEITSMIGFEHKHPHHHLDVWQHTLMALENGKSSDLEINMALLLHDIGKPFSFQDSEVRHFHGHPEVSAQMSKVILKRLGYDEPFIKDVVYLVRTHDTIIDPDNLDNSYNMVQKRLLIQYADAQAHKPETVGKRVKFLDEINSRLQKALQEERD